MDAITQMFAVALPVALVLHFEWVRRKKDRHDRLIRNLRQVLGPDLD